MLLENVGSIFPGDMKKNIPIKFLSLELVLKNIRVGSDFLIKDGKTIGNGKVVRMIYGKINPQ